MLSPRHRARGDPKPPRPVMIDLTLLLGKSATNLDVRGFNLHGAMISFDSSSTIIHHVVLDGGCQVNNFRKMVVERSADIQDKRLFWRILAEASTPNVM